MHLTTQRLTNTPEVLILLFPSQELDTLENSCLRIKTRKGGVVWVYKWELWKKNSGDFRGLLGFITVVVYKSTINSDSLKTEHTYFLPSHVESFRVRFTASKTFSLMKEFSFKLFPLFVCSSVSVTTPNGAAIVCWHTLKETSTSLQKCKKLNYPEVDDF